MGAAKYDECIEKLRQDVEDSKNVEFQMDAISLNLDDNPLVLDDMWPPRNNNTNHITQINGKSNVVEPGHNDQKAVTKMDDKYFRFKNNDDADVASQYDPF